MKGIDTITMFRVLIEHLKGEGSDSAELDIMMDILDRYPREEPGTPGDDMARHVDINVETGDIRWVGPGGKIQYELVELHRYVCQYVEDVQDGLIATEDIINIFHLTPSRRHTDHYIALQAPFNVDDKMASHLNGGMLYQFVDGVRQMYSSRVALTPPIGALVRES